MNLAAKARGAISPNPMVGAVVVKGGRIVGRGYHKRAGLAHAEVLALQQAGEKARGADLYVTLEPCAHYGRTPPCVDQIIKSRVKQVFVGMHDPNPLNNGLGIKILRRNGIKVEAGILEEQLKELNRPFIKYITRRLPFVTVKVGQSLDGKIAARSGDSKWITSDLSRNYARKMRGSYDGIMVGVNTVLKDNPQLNAYCAKRQPLRIVVDTQLSTPENAFILRSPGALLVTLPQRPGQETENRKALSRKAEILEVREKDGQVNLRDMMKRLAKKGLSNILVEGGGTLIGSLFDEGLVDKVIFFIAPKIIGGKEAIASVGGSGVSRVEKAHRVTRTSFRRMGEDLVVEGYVHRDS
jgi:diaminohydroxyphosphoribosylaminopyrimidine deaminase/5-amino-6-(5-phosphoribosylamino)uracil reductase